MKIYVDSENRCHTTNPDNIFREVEVDFFDGKCATFVEGYCYDDSDDCVQIYPCKPSSELDDAQREYEKQLLEEYETELAELRENSISLSELDAAYQEGVNSAYDQ